MFNSKVGQIIEAALDKRPLDKDDCAYLLGFDESSLESGVMRSVADSLIRERTDSSAVLFGQIGVEVAPCPADCAFCSFGKSHTSFPEFKIPEEDLRQKVNSFCSAGDLYGLYLMTMHTYDLDFFIKTVKSARHTAGDTNIFANIGDTCYDDLKEIKEAGVRGIYHVCRLGEGQYTKITPETRIKTICDAKDAGLEILTCVEPIGPENSIQELVDRMFIGIKCGCSQIGVMRRVAVPGTPLEQYGQISEYKLAHILSVLTLATSGMKNPPHIGIHEPNKLGYVSGACTACAESGANPRDNAEDTSKGRGADMNHCRTLLYECGFKYLLRGNGSRIELNAEYISKAESS